jgi:hypothetical protein
MKVVTDPKTGRMETVQDVPASTPETVARTRRELRDMLDGATPFHVDPNAAPVEGPLLDWSSVDWSAIYMAAAKAVQKDMPDCFARRTKT